MDIKAIYVLNRALDGKDVFMLPSFAKLPMSNMLIEAVKDDMVAAGLLENHSTFTQEGAYETKLLQEYKMAVKYVKINGLLLGLLNNTRGIALKKNYGKKDDYSFMAVEIEGGAETLFAQYPFLRQEQEKQAKLPQRTLPYEKLEQEYNLNPGNCVWFSTMDVRQKNKPINDVIFTSSGVLYHYNRGTRVLACKTSEEIQHLFKERLAV